MQTRNQNTKTSATLTVGGAMQSTFSETMIGTKDIPTTAKFYTEFLGMEVSNPGDGVSHIILKDPRTNQTLLIVADPSIVDARASIESKNIDATLEKLVLLGGKVLDSNTYPTMKVATVTDADGRKMCVWQTTN